MFKIISVTVSGLNSFVRGTQCRPRTPTPAMEGYKDIFRLRYPKRDVVGSNGIKTGNEDGSVIFHGEKLTVLAVFDGVGSSPDPAGPPVHHFCNSLQKVLRKVNEYRLSNLLNNQKNHLGIFTCLLNLAEKKASEDIEALFASYKNLCTEIGMTEIQSTAYIENLRQRPIDAFSTLSMVIIDRHLGRCYSFNMGDSGWKVVRNGAVIQESSSTDYGYQGNNYMTTPSQFSLDVNIGQKRPIQQSTSFLLGPDDASQIEKEIDQICTHYRQPSADFLCQTVELKKGDTVVVSTDGLWDLFDGDKIAKMVQSSAPENLCATFITEIDNRRQQPAEGTPQVNEFLGSHSLSRVGAFAVTLDETTYIGYVSNNHNGTITLPKDIKRSIQLYYEEKRLNPEKTTLIVGEYEINFTKTLPKNDDVEIVFYTCDSDTDSGKSASPTSDGASPDSPPSPSGEQKNKKQKVKK